MSPLLEFALKTAVRAGKLTLAHFQSGVQVERKGDLSPVTIADREAERFIREEIARTYQNHGIYGEEEGKEGDQSARWVIDPIDGTKSFISGVPLFGTLLSYEENEVPVVGVAYFPALDEVVFAERGEGAFWNGRPARVSKVSDLKDAVICCGGHGSMDKHGRTPGITNLARKALATRTWSDAYGHMLVATGRVEAMIDPVVEWYDASAVKLIVQEAGGTHTNFDGTGDWKKQAVSTNGHLLAEILRAFA